MIQFSKKVLIKIQQFFYCCIEHEIVQFNVNENEFPEKLKRVVDRCSLYFKCVPIDDDSIPVVEKHFGKRLAKSFVRRLPDSKGYLIIFNNIPVGYGWSTYSFRYKEGEKPFLYNIDPAPGTAYFYDGFVIPEERSRGGILLVIYQLLGEVIRDNKTIVFLTHDSMNSPMKSVAERIGFQKTGAIRYRKILGIPFKDIKDLEKVCNPSLL